MEFVTLEIAKKLKEKGFKMPCIAHYYCLVGNVLNYNITTDCIRGSNFKCLNDEYNLYIDAPTISQVLEWLREEKKIAINIEFIPYVWQYEIFDMSFESRFEPCGLTLFSNYEEAALAGIEYTLDNLI